MTVEFFVYFQFLLCFITGLKDGVRERCLKWDGGGCGEDWQIGNHPKQLKRG